MGKFMCMVIFGVIAVALMECTAAKVHVVGDDIGWTIQTSGDYYDTWASKQNFIVGDVLTFKFETNQHNVLQVPKASYDECSSSNPIGNLITVGPAKINLNSSGKHYFICTIGQHCKEAGTKLAITVSATPGTSPPSGGGSSTQPSTTPGCTPPPRSGPTGPNPPSDNPTGPPKSSSTVVLACVFGSTLAIVMHSLSF